MFKLSSYDGCYCRKCLKVSDVKVGQWPVAGMMMIVCKTYGNKRCPHAHGLLPELHWQQSAGASRIVL